MAWDDDSFRDDLAEIFGEHSAASLKMAYADEGLSVRQLSQYNRPSPKTDEEMRAYKAQKGRQYRSSEYIKKKFEQPSEATREALRRRTLERRIMRERMADVRSGVTHKFTIIARCNKLKCVAGRVGDHPCTRCGGAGTREIDGYLTCNTYDDGRLGEIFIKIGKAGAEEAIYEQWAISASVALQFGVPVEAYFRKFLATQFEPAGATKNKDIPRCTSILDYVAKYVLSRYVVAEAEVRP